MNDLQDVYTAFVFGFAIGAGAVASVVVAFGGTHEDGVEDTRMEAIQAGVAEWPRNGDFKWKEIPQ